MTVSSHPAITAERRAADRQDPMRDGDGVRLRAQCRHVGTVVTISGDVDATNVDRVADFATRFAMVANAVVLDLSGARFIAVQAVSVLMPVDDACRAAQVP